MRAATPSTSLAMTVYSAVLSARYRNFLVPLLTLGVIGGFNALLTAQSGVGDAGWWPVAWMATMFLGVFFCAITMAIAGRRKLPVGYGIALGAVVGLGLTTYGVLATSLHAPWGGQLPDWFRGAHARNWLGSPWAPLFPYGVGLAVHCAAVRVFSRPRSPRSPG